MAGGGGGGGGRLPDQSFTMFAAICSPSSLSVLILFPLHYEHHIFNEGGWGGVFSPSRNVSSIRVFINHTEAFRAAGTRVSHGEISLEFHLADALSDLGELAWIIFLGDDGRETVLRRRGRKKTTPKTQNVRSITCFKVWRCRLSFGLCMFIYSNSPSKNLGALVTNTLCMRASNALSRLIYCD